MSVVTQIPRTQRDGWNPARANRAAAAPIGRAQDKALIESCKRAITLGMFSLIFLQRLAISFSSGQYFQLILVIWLGLVVTLWRLQVLRFNSKRLAGLLLSIVLISVVNVISATIGHAVSVPSILLFVVTFTLLSTESKFDLSEFAQSRFVTMMAIVAIASIAQFVLQFAGVQYSDLLATLIPPHYLATQFNTVAPVHYGSSIYRSNGIVFVEPSTFSQFLGLAVLLTIKLRGPIWRVPVLLCALACTVSGTGLELLAIGLVCCALALGHRDRYIRVVLVLMCIGFVCVQATTLGASFSARSTEFGSNGSSAYYRYIDPYKIAVSDVTGITSLPLGAGAGAVKDVPKDQQYESPLFNFVTKLFIEDGLIACLVVSVFILSSAVRAVPEQWLAITLLIWLLTNVGLLDTGSWLALYLLFFMHSGPARMGAGTTAFPPPSLPLNVRHQHLTHSTLNGATS